MKTWLILILFHLWMLLYTVFYRGVQAKYPLHIGGMYPSSHIYVGHRMIEMEKIANMAIRDINAREDILNQYELKLKLKDDKVNENFKTTTNVTFYFLLFMQVLCFFIHSLIKSLLVKFCIMKHCMVHN